MTVEIDFSCHSSKSCKIFHRRMKRRRAFLLNLKDHNLRRRYGIGLEQYEAMLKKQRGVCAICGRKSLIRRQRYLDVDHDKSDKQVRGLLCNHCNRGIAFLRHDTKLLASAISYLLSFAVEIP